MGKIVSKKELVYASIFFLLLFSINKKDTTGKRARKKIVMDIKRTIAIARNHYDSNDYLAIVHKSQDIISEANDMMVLEDGNEIKNVSIDPGKMFILFRRKSPECFINMNIDEKYISIFMESYKDTGKTYITLMFVNRLIKIVESLDIEDTIKKFKG